MDFCGFERNNCTSRDVRNSSTDYGIHCSYIAWKEVVLGRAIARSLGQLDVKVACMEHVSYRASPSGAMHAPTTTQRLRVLIVDDHAVIRAGVAKIIDATGEYEVCGNAVDGWDAIEQVKRNRPDIVILDLTMPRLNGIEAARRIHDEFPEISILVLTAHDSEALLAQVLRSGARGYIVKSDAAKVMVRALHALQQNQTFLTPRLARLVVDDFVRHASADTRHVLTREERQIVEWLAEGKSNREIGVINGTSMKAVEAQRAKIMNKLSITTISELVCYAVRSQIIEP
jgi:two-component system, NarL family, response regulator NreC